jgi:lysophospholipase L1-like esterase
MQTNSFSVVRGLLSRRTIGVFTLSILFISTGWAASSSADDGDDEHWVGTWSTALHEPDLLVPGLANTGFNNQTLRQIVHTSIGGRRVRVRLSTFGATSLVIGAAHIALAGVGSAIVPNSDRELSFGGKSSITIPAGAPVVSDAVDLAVPALGNLAVSIFVPGVTGPATWHFEARQTSYISPSGNFSASDVMPIVASAQAWFWLSGVEVKAAAQTGAIATFGDSTTDGTHSTLDANHRWPDQLARRLIALPRNERKGVVNAGLAGNRLLHDSLGPNGLARFDRDVLSQPGLTDVIVLLGNADIGEGWSGGSNREDEVSADQIIQGYKQLIERAHAKGLSIYGATLTPFEGFVVPGTPFPFFSPANEEKRQEVNEWIRTGGEYDGVIDFDEVLRDPDHPSRMLVRYDSGDHVHPTDDGYRALADAIDLRLFRSRDRY